MFKYAIFVFCYQILFVMASSNWYGSSRCCGSEIGSATGGRSFEVVSSSQPPTGLSVVSENVYEGNVGIGGKLPFLGSAAVEAVAPTEGCSKICYGCGNQVSLEGERGCSGAAGLRGCGCGSPKNWGWSVSL